MPTRRLPNSTPAILRGLKIAHDTWLNTPNPADRPLSPGDWAMLDLSVVTSLHSRFRKEASEVDLAQALQAPLTTALGRSGARLTMFCSHFHQVLDLGIARATFREGARSYYGRDIGATTLPDLGSYEAIEAARQAIVDGEPARQAAEGAAFVPMALPSAAEVGAELATFKTSRQQAQQAQVRTDREREDVQALYAEAQTFATDLCDAVEYFFRKDHDAASFRTKCARWGVVYVYDTGEPVPAAPAAAAHVPPADNPPATGNPATPA